MTNKYKIKEIVHTWTTPFIRRLQLHSKFKLVTNIYSQAILSDKLIHGRFCQSPTSKLKLVSYAKIKMEAIL